MILHDPSTRMSFPDYGILIPSLNSRAASVLSNLESGRRGDRPARIRVLGGMAEAARFLGEDRKSLAIGRTDLARVHDGEYVDRLFQGGSALEEALLSAYELLDENGRPNRWEPARAVKPLSALFSTILEQVAGTYTACRIALADRGPAVPGPASLGSASPGPASPGSAGSDLAASAPGFCFFLGGGMHHARPDGGSGFCLVNDIMIASARLRAEGRISLVWIVDVDAHKGDGTAEIARASRGPSAPFVLALSIHMASGWPLDGPSLERAAREGRGADRAPLVPSDVEIPIAAGSEADYLPRLREGLSELERLSDGRTPDLAIVVDGADPYQGDGLPSSAGLALSLEACVERDETVLGFLDRRNIPSAWLMAGGYGERAWEPPAAFLNRLRGRGG